MQLPLCQLCKCNLYVSYSVMLVYTLKICITVLLLYALAFHSLALTSPCVAYNILNTQRYAFSAAVQTYRYSDKAAKGGSRYLCLNENVSLLRHSIVLIRHHWRDLQAALGKIAMKMCGRQQDFVT